MNHAKLHIPVITIDGPTASGKGTVAHTVADRLGFHYLDSGALYRLTALSAHAPRHRPDATSTRWPRLAEHLPVRFVGGRHPAGQRKTSRNAIRAEEVGNTASKIAALPAVRQALFALQRASASRPAWWPTGATWAR